MNQLLPTQQDKVLTQHSLDRLQDGMVREPYEQVAAARHLREAREEVARLESRRASLQREMALLDMNLYDARLRHVRAELSYRQLCHESGIIHEVET